MLSTWQLPTQAVIGGVRYDIHGDFRDILEIVSYLNCPSLPRSFRWRIALGLFYEQPVPPAHYQQAVAYLSLFLQGGSPRTESGGPAYLDWQTDAQMIVSDVNAVAAQEIRALPFVHWWTFLSWFDAIGEGQLSTLVRIRSKLHRGQKLEGWERDYYRSHKALVERRAPLSQQEQAHKQQVERLLR